MEKNYFVFLVLCPVSCALLGESFLQIASHYVYLSLYIMLYIIVKKINFYFKAVIWSIS